MCYGLMCLYDMYARALSCYNRCKVLLNLCIYGMQYAHPIVVFGIGTLVVS